MSSDHIYSAPCFPYPPSLPNELNSQFPFFSLFASPFMCTFLDQHPIRVRIPLESGWPSESWHERKLTLSFFCLRSSVSSEILCHLPASVLECSSKSSACFHSRWVLMWNCFAVPENKRFLDVFLYLWCIQCRDGDSVVSCDGEWCNDSGKETFHEEGITTMNSLLDSWTILSMPMDTPGVC